MQAETSTQGSSLLLAAEVAKNGFAITPPVFSGRELEAVLSDLAESNLHRSRAGARHILSHSSVAALASDSRLLSIAKDVLGPNAIPFRCTLFDKSLTANWLVVWHQDTALPLRQRVESSGWGPWSIKDGVNYAHAPSAALEQVLALRLHLDDSAEDNGPLRILPDTHTLGVLTDERIHDLSIGRRHVDCTVESGGVLAMRPLVLHASSKSRSGRPRRVLHFEYATCTAIASPLELLAP